MAIVTGRTNGDTGGDPGGAPARQRGAGTRDGDNSGADVRSGSRDTGAPAGGSAARATTRIPGQSGGGRFRTRPLPATSRVRQPVALIRLLGGLFAIALTLLLADYARATTSGIAADVAEAAALVPRPLSGLAAGLTTAAVLLLPVGLAVRRLLGPDRRRALQQVSDGLLAAVLAYGATLGLGLWADDLAPVSLLTALTQPPPSGGLGHTEPVYGYLAPVLAFMTASGSRERRLSWTVLALSGLAGLTGGYATPTALLLGLLIGWTGAHGTLYAVGTPDPCPLPGEVLRALRDSGLRPVEAKPAGPDRYRVRQADGLPELDVQILDRQAVTAAAVQRAWRRLRLRTAPDPRVLRSPRTGLEHEALVTYAALAAGVRTRRIAATAGLGQDTALIAYERLAGRTLDELADEEITDDLLTDAWRQLALLQRREIAHRALVPSSLLIDDSGAVHLVDFADGDIAATELVLCCDLAQLLTTLALRAGAARSVHTATAVLGPDPVGAALPLLQPIALTHTTRRALKQHAKHAAAGAAGGTGAVKDAHAAGGAAAGAAGGAGTGAGAGAVNDAGTTGDVAGGVGTATLAAPRGHEASDAETATVTAGHDNAADTDAADLDARAASDAAGDTGTITVAVPREREARGAGAATVTAGRDDAGATDRDARTAGGAAGGTVAVPRKREDADAADRDARAAGGTVAAPAGDGSSARADARPEPGPEAPAATPGGLLDEIRAEVLRTRPQVVGRPVRLERLRPRTLLVVVGGVMAGWLLLPQLFAAEDNPVSALADADPWWLLLAVLAAATSHVAAAMGFVGFVPERLDFRNAVLAQVAGSFVKLVSPGGVGGIALNTRFLQRAGIPTAQALSSVGVGNLIGLALHLLQLGAFVYLVDFAPGSSELDALSAVVGGLAGAVALLAVVSAIPVARRWLATRLRPLTAEVLPRLLDLLRSPSRLAVGVTGQLLVSLCLIACLYCSVRAIGREPSFAAVAVVFLVGNAVGSAAPTPGGAGAVDGMLLGLLQQTASMERGGELAAVALYRLLTLILPVLPGWAAFVWLQRRRAL
ncbi:lysylphosphatidylglycerol synthase domain-containing protein [Kitasatospora sp. NPDC048286]|uniref:lysylphosphatidylglycerol synthase domain-containing protein n=1 Tax=Kitasatospora sp. NPDC048286 TaxID=3364047 RepID=UPI003719827B